MWEQVCYQAAAAALVHRGAILYTCKDVAKRYVILDGIDSEKRKCLLSVSIWLVGSGKAPVDDVID